MDWGFTMAKYVYVCLVGWDYEGTQLDAVYTKLRFARKHAFSPSDFRLLLKVRLDKPEAEKVELSILGTRKKKK